MMGPLGVIHLFAKLLAIPDVRMILWLTLDNTFWIHYGSPFHSSLGLHHSSLFRHRMSEMSTAEDSSQALAHFSIWYTGKLNGREFLWISGTALGAIVYWKLKWPKIVHRTQPVGKLNSSFLLLVTAMGFQRNLEKHQEERNQRRKITGKCGKRTANSSWR